MGRHVERVFLVKKSRKQSTRVLNETRARTAGGPLPSDGGRRPGDPGPGVCEVCVAVDRNAAALCPATGPLEQGPRPAGARDARGPAPGTPPSRSVPFPPRRARSSVGGSAETGLPAAGPRVPGPARRAGPPATDTVPPPATRWRRRAPLAFERAVPPFPAKAGSPDVDFPSSLHSAGTGAAEAQGPGSHSWGGHCGLCPRVLQHGVLASSPLVHASRPVSTTTQDTRGHPLSVPTVVGTRVVLAETWVVGEGPSFSCLSSGWGCGFYSLEMMAGKELGVDQK